MEDRSSSTTPYGFPIELTKEYASDEGLLTKRAEAAMTEQQNARKHRDMDTDGGFRPICGPASRGRQ